MAFLSGEYKDDAAWNASKSVSRGGNTGSETVANRQAETAPAFAAGVLPLLVHAYSPADF